MEPSRREFLERTALAMTALGASGGGWARSAEDTSGPIDSRRRTDKRTYLSRILHTRQEIDDWLAGRAFQFEKYDGELGWVLRDLRMVDGIDRSTSTYRYGQFGERQTVRYADLPCRVNTYGDSFTQCHQVSDGETWQEVLAAHLGEPIRNFGVGGYSVYQAYRRLLREEARTPAGVVVFNIYSDDHTRNPTGWRFIRDGSKHAGPYMLPPLPHLRVNCSTGECDQRENPCPTEESLPTCFRIVNSTGTWGDYYMARNPPVWQQSVHDYLQRLKDAGIEYEAVGLQYYHAGRDLLEIERNLESFQGFARPIHITETGFPSGTEGVGDVAWWGGGVGGGKTVWRGERFTEETQAQWLEALYTIAFSKPYVEAITWWDLSDPAFIPNGGLVRADGDPRPAYQ